MNMLPLTSTRRSHRLHILRVVQHLLAQITVHESTLDALLFAVAGYEGTVMQKLIFHAAQMRSIRHPIRDGLASLVVGASCTRFPRLIRRVYHGIMRSRCYKLSVTCLLHACVRQCLQADNFFTFEVHRSIYLTLLAFFLLSDL